MSDYIFPDEDEVPKIRTDRSDYEFPETKTLFITYDSDEWDHPDDVANVLETINHLFDTGVQVVALPEDFDLLNKEEVRGVMESL